MLLRCYIAMSCDELQLNAGEFSAEEIRRCAGLPAKGLARMCTPFVRARIDFLWRICSSGNTRPRICSLRPTYCTWHCAEIVRRHAVDVCGLAWVSRQCMHA